MSSQVLGVATHQANAASFIKMMKEYLYVVKEAKLCEEGGQQKVTFFFTGRYGSSSEEYIFSVMIIGMLYIHSRYN